MSGLNRGVESWRGRWRSDHPVVRQGSGDSSQGSDQRAPRPTQQRQPHHAPRVALGDAAGPKDPRPEGVADGTVHCKPLKHGSVSRKDLPRHTCHTHEFVQQRPAHTVKTLPQVNHGNVQVLLR
eukprot:14026140-Alexandrium_andersonii.AAC.1